MQAIFLILLILSAGPSYAATSPSACFHELDSAWNPAAGHLTLAYADSAIFTLKEQETGDVMLVRQQTRFPKPVTKMRALQTSAFSFQVSGLVAGIDRDDSHTLWFGSLLFPQTEKVELSESVLDIAWQRVAPGRYRLLALTRSGLVAIECDEKKGRAVLGKVETRFTFPGASPRVWDRVFPVSAETTFVLGEMGELGQITNGTLSTEKFANYVYSARMAEFEGGIYLCGVFSLEGSKQPDRCFRRSAEGAWVSAPTPTPLVLPSLPEGKVGEQIVEPSFPLRVLMRHEAQRRPNEP